MDIIDKLKKENKELEEKQSLYKKDLQDVKEIIKSKFNNKDGYFVFDFLRKNLFNNDEVIDLNPQKLAFNQGKQYVYNMLLSLLDDELIINYVKENGK